MPLVQDPCVGCKGIFLPALLPHSLPVTNGHPQRNMLSVCQYSLALMGNAVRTGWLITVPIGSIRR